MPTGQILVKNSCKEFHENTAEGLTLSDPTLKLVRQYDFPVSLRCRKTSDTGFVALGSPAVGACPMLFLM
jgi:hypothetical protein